MLEYGFLPLFKHCLSDERSNCRFCSFLCRKLAENGAHGALGGGIAGIVKPVLIACGTGTKLCLCGHSEGRCADDLGGVKVLEHALHNANESCLVKSLGYSGADRGYRRKLLGKAITDEPAHGKAVGRITKDSAHGGFFSRFNENPL